MPDLLAHALLAYSVATVLSWRFGWIDRSYVTVAMAGAFIPDLVKIWLVVPNQFMKDLLGIPFNWAALTTLGGSITGIAVGVVLVKPSERVRVASLLGVGAFTHLFSDSLLITPSGHITGLFWPFTRYSPWTPGVYLSTEPWPTLLMGVLAGLVYLASEN